MPQAQESSKKSVQKPQLRAPPAWPKKALRASAAKAAVRDDCAVLELAREAAAVMRLERALNQHEVGDKALFDALQHPDDFLRPSDMWPTLHDRLHAIEALASHRRATSLKGALFQLYLAASESQNTPGLFVSMPANDEETLNTRDRKVANLHYAAIAQLEAMAGPDEDLALLRSRYFPALYDAHAGCERALAAAGRPPLVSAKWCRRRVERRRSCS
jgi:hypothetical protein